ncbi:MAG: cobalamin biosynthesis protein [Candidatus Bathyarchaeota archaeon]|nr:cobalamin biosynthesis protein [Candidatus Bathyarchaeota archaeon]
MYIFDLSFFVDSALIFALAFLIDVVFGEIPDNWHPTVWMGKVIAWFKRHLKHSDPVIEKFNGIFLCIISIAVFAAPVALLLWALRQIPVWGWIIYIIAAAVLLKTTIAVKCMKTYTAPIANALKNNDIAEARKWLYYIVRRDPNKLDQRHILSAAVESIAESTTDGITSPFFFYALFGVPGAFAFRVINTLDSMVGYKDPENINIGWFSANMDTITNYLPARFTAVLMVVAARLLHADWRNSWNILQRDKNKTASPNAGWTISAMAGALNVQLEKIGYYALGDGENIVPEDISRALKIMLLTAVLFGLVVILPILLLLSLSNVAVAPAAVVCFIF